MEPSYAQSRELILEHGWNATAYQILNPGIAHWISEERRGLVGYVEAGKRLGFHPGMWIAAGEPVCAEVDVAGVADAFEAAAARAGRRVCWFGADCRLREILGGKPGYSEMVLGAQPVWDPHRWPAILAGKASLRAQLNRARNKGITVTKRTQREAEGNAELQRCLDEWLHARGLPGLHFLVEPQTLHQLEDRWVFVASHDTAPVGFLVLTPVPARNGWLVEQIIQGKAAPNGTASLLLDAAMTAAADSGSSYLTLGLSPLSFRAPASNPTPVWMRALFGWLRAHGRRFYNFQGLEAFKAKFVPDRWDPIVAITNESRPSLGTLHAIADAFSGPRSPERLLGRAVFDAAGEELRALGRKFRRSTAR